MQVDTFSWNPMSTKKTIALIVALLITVALVIGFIALTAGTPKGMVPSTNMAPNSN